jgi:triacylglycerol lipase
MNLRTPLSVFNIKTSFAPLLEWGVFDGHESVPFEHMSTYSPVNAWYMAECSRLSYGDFMFNNSKISAFLKKVGMHTTKFWDVEGTQVFVSYNDEMIWLVCTGTELEEGIADVMVDLQAWPVDTHDGSCKVHAGFQRAINYVLDDVLEFVNELSTTRKELYITGHSLGGALAILFGTHLDNTGTYTFGCPRVLGKGGNALTKGPVFRIEELHDIVTRIPLPPVFEHVGDSYFIDNDQNFFKNPSLWKRTRERLGDGELTTAWNLVKLFVLKGAGTAVLQYLHGHSPYNYSVYCWNNIVRNGYARR